MYSSPASYQYAAEEAQGSVMGAMLPLAGYMALDYLHGSLQKSPVWDANPGFQRGIQRSMRGPRAGRNQRVESFVKDYWGKSKQEWRSVEPRARTMYAERRADWGVPGNIRPGMVPEPTMKEARAAATATMKTRAGSVTYKKFRREAKVALAKASLGRVTGMALGAANFLFIAPLVYDTAKAGYAGIRDAGSMLRSVSWGSMNLPQMAATERQRALSALHNSELNARSALGNEASYMHR